MNMASKTTSSFFLLSILLILQSTLTKTSPNSGQVFIQTEENELRFMIDGIPLPITTADSIIFPEHGSFLKNEIKTPIIFNPPLLDFNTQHVGMPSLQRVHVSNQLPDESIQLLSIYGSTPHFHCSFFRDKNLPPGGNTTFDVIFLARHVGHVEHALKIYTSRGLFIYHVFGIGVGNPYRLKPLIGARVPLNSSFSPIISIHNPSQNILQIVEMFSSGGNLHLELPTGSTEANRSLWEVKPFETKPIMRATHIARKASNETGFIRIKARSYDGTDDLIIIPLEIEVSGDPGLYSPQYLLDFGTVHSLSDSKSIPLFVINSRTKPVEVVEITTEPKNRAIYIEKHESVVLPGLSSTSMIGTVTLKPSHLQAKGWATGYVVIKSKDGKSLKIPYTADILVGSLQIDDSKLFIHSSELVETSDLFRPLYVKNNFNRPIVIYNITKSNDVWLTKAHLSKPVMIQPNVSMELCKLRINPMVKRMKGGTSAHLSLHTNVSDFSVPVHVFDGSLKTLFQHNDKELDFGALGYKETRELFFTLRNDNPVVVEIFDVSPTSAVTKVELFGLEEGSGHTLTHPPDVTKLKQKNLKLGPNHFAVYKVKLTAPSDEGNYAADIRVKTSYDTFYVPVRFKTSIGSVISVPEKIIFEGAFPTKVPLKVLKIRSSFAQYTEVTKVAFLPADQRFGYEPTKNTPTVLEPFQDTVIGHIYFDARRGLSNDSYVGLPLNSPGGLRWLSGLSLGPDTDVVDSNLYKRFRSKWNSLQHKMVNATVQVDTEWMQNFLLPAQANLVWPSLLEEGTRLRFPPTHIGNTTERAIVVRNPSSQPIILQILPLSLYPKADVVLDLFTTEVDKKKLMHAYNFTEKDIFTLRNLEKYNRKSSNPVRAYRENIRDAYNFMPHNDSIATTLLPDVKVSVLIGFQPLEVKNYVSLIVLRNNLTVIDALLVSGRGAASGLVVLDTFYIDSRPDEQIVRFDIREQHLKDCQRTDLRYLPESLIEPYRFRQSFLIHNNGTLPVYVFGFDVAGKSCANGPFIIVNCTEFELAANTTREVEVIVVPNFNDPLMETVITVRASNGHTQDITLFVTIPPSILPKCRYSLPRPEWEEWIHYTVMCVMSFLLFATFVLAYADMKNIFQQSLVKRLNHEGQGQLLNLRNVGDQSVSKSKSNGKSPVKSIIPGNSGTSAVVTILTSSSNELRKRSKTESLMSSNGSLQKSSCDKKQLPASSPTCAKINGHAPKTDLGLNEIKKAPLNKASKTNKPKIPENGVLPHHETSEMENNDNQPKSMLEFGKGGNKMVDIETAAKETKYSPKGKKENGLHSSNDQNALERDVLIAQRPRQAIGVQTKDSQMSNMANPSEKMVNEENHLNGYIGSTLPLLSDEARAKLQEDARAQLKKQKKAARKAKLAKSDIPVKEMVTKCVSTADLEDSQSVSTDSSSNVTSEGKSKHVKDWLYTLDDKTWMSNSQWPGANGNHRSNASDDFSEFANQTEAFVNRFDSMDPRAASDQFIARVNPIGTKPVKNDYAWPFPSAESTLQRGNTQTPDMMTSIMSNGWGVTNNQPVSNEFDSSMMYPSSLKPLLEEKRRRHTEHAKKQELTSGLEDWLAISPSGWSDLNWNQGSTEAMSNPWRAADSSWTDLWGRPASNGVLGTPHDRPSDLFLPNSFSNQNEQRTYDPFLSNLWSPHPTQSDSTIQDDQEGHADSRWSFGRRTL